PGVYTMDGQVSIRGGSGFAYGAGSRVMLLWNGMPILSGDAGDAKWNAIPMECASQIEILKGASSVLYGSGALNGIISLNERKPTLKGETRIKVQTGIYDKPKRASLGWWTGARTYQLADAYYGKMYKNFGFTISANGYKNPGYKEGEVENRGRISGTLYIRPEKFEKLKAGIGYNFHYQKQGTFLIWQSDSLAYMPGGTADTSLAESTLTYNSGIRMSVDPYVKFFDKNKNLHTFKTRLYYVTNDNITNPSQNSNSTVSYGDYQFQKNWDTNVVLTAGVTFIRNGVQSNLFGNHHSENAAAYAQYEHRFDRLDLTGGVRFEYFEQDGKSGDTDLYLGTDTNSTNIPIYPIARFGAHYKIAKYSHLRASFGQGVRYPSVAERYTTTNVGALNIFANPDLTRETGWAAEIGFKQGVRIGKNWKGLIDVAGFINQYNNMMEFSFGIFDPTTSERLDPADPNYNATLLNLLTSGYTITDMFGFAAENSESARIMGVEFSFNSQGKIGEVELTSLIGYTYMSPNTLNTDSAYLHTFSTYEYDDVTNTASYNPMLKYRFNHLIKADIEASWKNISLGMSVRYNSYMENIDAVFEENLTTSGDPLYILPGLANYRELNNIGLAVLDARFGYKIKDHYRVGFMVNNLLNTEYVSRPGDVQAPRSFILQLQMKF
ncbi:MAG: TonB-dependent receptor, partial [Crocinitomicaceae bacterium]|nr:TonB-dependent receptor [Crocinitomicaceae bacterium]